ncbi:hypothetical protein FA95DRAFT_1611683 [Auriscalpium vulgare]|uniref:Uncharacterized protein n=1 Tax=Auriscalpium vulgare TaxID=40419 RepID=A0ACB8R9B3_9AGAM|nr:hypothetical protein FA95DRAFT_1611683 [Auriscalpium vulgare]
MARRGSARLTDAAKKRRQDKQVRLTQAVREAQKEYVTKATSIAVEHGRSLEWVVGQLHLGGRRLTKKRAASPWSTFIGRQLRKLNQGKSKGDKWSISKFLEEDKEELQEAYEQLTEAEKATLKEEGERSRKERAVLPMRKSEKSVQKDFHETFKALANEVHGGLQRTQGEAIMFGVRGEVTQYGAPEIYVSPKAKAFLAKSFGLTPEQFALRLEAFVLADLGNDHGSRAKKSMVDDQSTARRAIQDGHDSLLFKTKGIKPGSLKMNYRNYEGKVVEEHKIELRGWPLPGPVQNPGSLKRQELTTLLRALENQTCRWEKMTDVELAARIQHNHERLTRGEEVYIPRKARKAPSVPANAVAGPSSTPSPPPSA